MTQFLDRLDKAREELGFTWKELATFLGISPKTIEEWRFKDSEPREKCRNIISAKLPGFFGYELLSQKMLDEAMIPIPLPPQSDRAIKTVNEIDLRVKTELVKERVMELSRLLRWFLYEANAEDRNKLRAEMGEDWEWFLSLTRAMLGESTFNSIEKEGSLNPERRPRI